MLKTASRFFAIFVCLLLALSSMAQAGVTLTIGNGSALPGSPASSISVSLQNSDQEIRGVQLDICDTDNYLLCLECAAAGRAAESFACQSNELANGCARVILVSLGGEMIAKGSGEIVTVSYDVDGNAPLDECRDLEPEEIKISDAQLAPLPADEITAVAGSFCFTQPPTTTTTTTPSSTTTTVPLSSQHRVSISPLAATLNSGLTLQFTARTTLRGEEVSGSEYTWKLDPASTIGSTLFDTGIFVAGANAKGADQNEIVKVADAAHDGRSATATVTVRPQAAPPEECVVVVSPLAATLPQSGTLLLTATSLGDCAQRPAYAWSLETAIEGSSVTPQGATCLYAAGTHATGQDETDVVTVVDTANDVRTTAEIVVPVNILSLYVEPIPYPMWQSSWIPLPYILSIQGFGTGFDPAQSVVAFEPPYAVQQVLPVVAGTGQIWDLVLVMPRWATGGEDKGVAVTVTTGNEVAQGEFSIAVLPAGLSDAPSVSGAPVGPKEHQR